MPAKDLGIKHTCFKCGTKFYDLKKSDPLCPKCGTDQRESPALKAPGPAERRNRPAARPVVEPEKELEVDAEPELEEELDESGEDVVQTTDDE